MALPITVPFTFGNATTTQSLSSLDADFSTVYNAVNGIGNGTVSLANVSITGSAYLATTSGNVGIGTSSPAYNLHVRNAGGNAYVATQYGTGTIGYMVAGSNEVQFKAFNGTNDVMTFATGASERMRIDSSGNVGIGTSVPSASAILDAQSTTKGVRFPNMTTAQKNAISSPAAGLVIFDTTLSKLCVYTGAAWQTITSA